MAGKEFGASVPEEEYQRFQQRFGGFYGATKWFINSALKEFNDRVEREPTLQLQVSQAIEQMVQLNREVKRYEFEKPANLETRSFIGSSPERGEQDGTSVPTSDRQATG